MLCPETALFSPLATKSGCRFIYSVHNWLEHYTEGEGRKFIADWTNLIPKLRNYARTPRNFFHPYRKLPFYTQLESLSNIILSRANNFSGIDRSDGTIEAVDPEKLHATILKYTARGSKSSNRSTYKEYTDYIYIYIWSRLFSNGAEWGKKKKRKKNSDRSDAGVGGLKPRLRIRRSSRFCQLATVSRVSKIKVDEEDVSWPGSVNHRCNVETGVQVTFIVIRKILWFGLSVEWI